jgi:hypothetical protein
MLVGLLIGQAVFGEPSDTVIGDLNAARAQRARQSTDPSRRDANCGASPWAAGRGLDPGLGPHGACSPFMANRGTAPSGRQVPISARWCELR